MPQETIRGVIENIAYRVFGAAHDAFHAINRAQVVAAVDALAASGPHENVFVVIRHADDFVGHDLANGENQVEAALSNQPVHLRRPRVVQLAFRLLADKFRRNLAQSLNIGSPVMHAKKLLRYYAEHSLDLIGLHGGMCAEGGQHRLQPITVEFPCVTRQVAGAGVHAAVVGRNDEDAVPWSQSCQAFRKKILQLWKQIAFESACAAVEAHAANSTFLSPGASRERTIRASR